MRTTISHDQRIECLRHDVKIGLQIWDDVRKEKQDSSAFKMILDWLKDQTKENNECFYTKSELRLGLRMAKELLKNGDWKDEEEDE
jgi:hypothetical protein